MTDFTSDPLTFLMELDRQISSIASFELAGETAYFISGLYVEQALVEYASALAPGRSMMMLKHLGNGLLRNSGESWRVQRKLVGPAFRHGMLATYADVITKYSEEMVHEWRDGEVHWDREVTNATMRIISHILFGLDKANLLTQVEQAIAYLQRVFSGAVEHISNPHEKQKAIEKIDKLIYTLIQEHKSGSSDEYSLTDSLLRARYADGSFINDQQLRDELLVLFLAGHETMAVAITWAGYLASRHPHVQSMLASEMEHIMDGQNPNINNITSCTYMDAFWHEVLRLYPPAWIMTRTVIRAIWLGHHHITEGTQIVISPAVAHLNSAYFVNPHIFEPERWLGRSLAEQLPNYAYFPFGIGPRNCVGQHLANLEMRLMFATILSNVKLLGCEEVRAAPQITLRPASPVLIPIETVKAMEEEP